MSIANTRLILNYVTSRSEKLLRRKFIRLQSKAGKQYQIKDIVHDGKKWVLWYYDLATDEEILKESLGVVDDG